MKTQHNVVNNSISNRMHVLSAICARMWPIVVGGLTLSYNIIRNVYVVE